MMSASRVAQIPCCLCGTMILPNAANQCSACLAQEIDLKSLLQRGPGGSHEIVIHQCRQCRRFERNERNYIDADWESPELLALCLKHIPALASSGHHNHPKLHLADAMWVWTEPNSMRLKIRLTVRAEIQNVNIQQRVMVELVVRFKMCPNCNREYTNRTWHAVVQLRQKRTDDSPRKGLAMLEMALARSSQIRKHVLKMDASRQGFDFYFLSLAEAQIFASYLSKVAPMRIKTTRKMVSQDVKNNTANLKHTVSCDMVPLCRDDLVMVHKSAKGNLTGRLCLVTKVSSVVHFVDASPKRSPAMDGVVGELSPETYYKSGSEKMYKAMSSSRRMIRFVVLDIERCGDAYGNADHDEERQLYHGPNSGVDKYALADVQVARESDFGVNDETFRCVTHLGNLLQVGDMVLGYDLVSSVLSGGTEWSIDRCFNSSFVMPDVILVKKVHGTEEKEEEPPQQLEREGKMSKKRQRRRKREEKKMRELEEAAGRMGFLDDMATGFDEGRFEQELMHDPDLAEDLRRAEHELGMLQESQVGDDRSTTKLEESGGVSRQNTASDDD